MRVCVSYCMARLRVVRVLMMMNRTSLHKTPFSMNQANHRRRRLNKEIKETHHKIWIVTFLGLHPRPSEKRYRERESGSVRAM